MTTNKEQPMTPQNPKPEGAKQLEVPPELQYVTKSPPSEAGIRVAILLDKWAGLHHFSPKALKAVEWDNPRYQILKLSKFESVGQLSTFDFNSLTTLVFLAHDHAIRVEVNPCTARDMELVFHPRAREGEFSRRHPTIEAALAQWRESNPLTFGDIK